MVSTSGSAGGGRAPRSARRLRRARRWRVSTSAVVLVRPGWRLRRGSQGQRTAHCKGERTNRAARTTSSSGSRTKPKRQVVARIPFQICEDLNATNDPKSFSPSYGSARTGRETLISAAPSSRSTVARHACASLGRDPCASGPQGPTRGYGGSSEGCRARRCRVLLRAFAGRHGTRWRARLVAPGSVDVRRGLA